MYPLFPLASGCRPPDPPLARAGGRTASPFFPSPFSLTPSLSLVPPFSRATFIAGLSHCLVASCSSVSVFLRGRPPLIKKCVDIAVICDISALAFISLRNRCCNDLKLSSSFPEKFNVGPSAPLPAPAYQGTWCGCSPAPPWIQSHFLCHRLTAKPQPHIESCAVVYPTVVSV